MSRALSDCVRSVLLLLFLLVLGCGSQTAEEPALRVGAIFDLTGATSDVGAIYAEGIRGFVEHTNAEGGIGGTPIDLLYQDYGYRVDRAEMLYTEFVQSGVLAFMGWGTGDTEALRARVREDQVPFMSASYSHVLGDPSEAPFNFLVGTTYSHQFLIILDWIIEQSDESNPDGSATKVALLHHPSPFGLSPYEQLGRDYADDSGIELLAEEMPRGSTDYTAELTRIVKWGADHVVFQNTSGPVALALSNASELGLDLSFYCLNWCTNELLVTLAGEDAEGVIGAMLFTPPSDAAEDHPGIAPIRDFLRESGSSLEDKGVLYVQGWWTMAIMAEGIRRAIESSNTDALPTGLEIRRALETIDGLDTGGATYPITFTRENHRGAVGMRLYRVENAQFVRLTDFRTAS